MKNKPDLDYARKFDAFWWSSLPEIKESADFICLKIPDKLKEKFKINRLKNHLKVILTNLHVAHSHNPQMFIAISMDKNYYRASKRYEKLYLSYKYVKFLVDYLLAQGYLEYYQGVNYANFRRWARIRASKKLLRLFRKYKTGNGQTIRRTLPVILRDSDKRDIDFDPNDLEVRTFIRNVNIINRCLANHKVDMKFSNSWEWEDFMIEWGKYSGCQKYTRIFNNSTFENGGRFYGHWSQQIKSEYRQYITIDDERTVELDYSCLHIFMLYCLEGIEPPVGDLYDIFASSDKYRPLIKKAVNIIFNAENETKAMQAINDERNRFAKDYPGLVFIPKADIIIEALRETHPAIQKYFCNGMGVRLQKMDSQIAEKILLNFAEKDICCLCIHDSFIIARKHEQQLRQLMRQYFMERFIYEPRISRKEVLGIIEDEFPSSVKLDLFSMAG